MAKKSKDKAERKVMAANKVNVFRQARRRGAMWDAKGTANLLKTLVTANFDNNLLKHYDLDTLDYANVRDLRFARNHLVRCYKLLRKVEKNLDDEN